MDVPGLCGAGSHLRVARGSRGRADRAVLLWFVREIKYTQNLPKISGVRQKRFRQPDDGFLGRCSKPGWLAHCNTDLEVCSVFVEVSSAHITGSSSCRHFVTSRGQPYLYQGPASGAPECLSSPRAPPRPPRAGGLSNVVDEISEARVDSEWLLKRINWASSDRDDGKKPPADASPRRVRRNARTMYCPEFPGPRPKIWLAG